jgi:predicted phosphoribosyltransferase
LENRLQEGGDESMMFENRAHAARLLAQRLSAQYKNRNALVFAIPRGAVPMAKIIADALGGELDVVLVHKLGAPGQPELAIGAIDEAGHAFLSDHGLDIDGAYLETEKHAQHQALKQRRLKYTPWRPPIDPEGRIVIVVDDGIATGSTMTAALRAIRDKKPEKVVAAAAVASTHAARAMAREADAVVCLEVTADFHAVGQFFDDFSQVTDDDVIAILKNASPEIAAPG